MQIEGKLNLTLSKSKAQDAILPRALAHFALKKTKKKKKKKKNRFLGQGLNPHHSGNQNLSNDNAGSLTWWATWEFQHYFSFTITHWIDYGIV